MNPGGIRAALPRPADGQLRYEDLFTVQPFYNNLVTMTLSGAQVFALLEQQWQQPRPRILQLSRGFSYAWDATRPVGQRVVPGSVRLHGRPLEAAAEVRVTVNSYLAAGGDGFSVLEAGRQRRTGIMDVDALELFVKDNPLLVPGPLDRITRLN
jgi:5'-nucleotidase